MSTGRVVVMDKHQRIQGATLSLSSKNFPVFKGVNTVGRNKTAVIDIKHLSVSQNQAVIVIVDDQQHFVSDLGSSNGTFLHDTQLVPFKLYELPNDSILRFGTITAKYVKPTNNDVTINLESQTMDITQNMTQTFYAADTQLYNNQTISGPNITSQDIHGLETQPVDYPLKQTVRINDIHSMETQPADYPFQPPLARCGKGNKSSGTEEIKKPAIITKVENDSSNLTENSDKCNEEDTAIEETATQVDDYSLKPLKDHDEYLKKRYRDDGENVAPTVVSEQFIGECFEDPYYHNNTNMDFSFPEETSEDQNLAECPQSDQDAETQVNDGIQSNMGPENNEEADADSEATQIVSTKGVPTEGSQPKYVPVEVIDDSFVVQAKCSRSFVDDSMADSGARVDNMEENSNESVDLLTMPFTVDSTNCVKNVHSHEESVNVPNVQETVTHVLTETAGSKVNSDSETDIDSSEEIIIESTSQINTHSVNDTKKSNTESDSETDIEEECGRDDNNSSISSETQQIRPVRVSRKPLFQSDSDTDVEEEKRNDGSISKPSIEAASGTAPSLNEHNKENLEEPGIELNENDGDTSEIKPNEVSSVNEKNLNDTDCIPATQDAFASVFSYKGSDQNHSSEESFKLGLTELMVDDADCNMENQADKVSQPEASEEKERVISDNGANPQITTGETNTHATEEMSDLLGHKQHIEQPEDKHVEDNLEGMVAKEGDTENDYLLPTQKMVEELHIDNQNTKNDEETCDDYYLMPTQEIENKSPFKVPTKKYTFKNKKVLLDATMSTLLNVVKEDDMYIAPTQMICSESDDVYMQATQSISQKPAGTGTKTTEDVGDDLYDQATQQIHFVKSNTNNLEDDVYLMATQPIQESKDIDPAGSSGTGTSEDVYDIATQVMIDEPTDSQTEIQNYYRSEATHGGGNRPGNPLAQVLQVKSGAESKKTLKRSNKDSLGSSRSKKLKKADIESLKMKIEEDTETLSQIEAFVHKPLDEIKKRPDEMQKTCLSLKKTKRQSEDIETLSQIEAFVNKPVASNPIKKDDNTDKIAVPKKRSRRLVRDCSDLNIPDELADETADTSKDISLDKNETFFNQSKEQEVKSEVDQSFAIMAAKVNKTKRTVKKTSNLCEIKVKDVKRTSMDIAEASKIQEHEISLPSRKSKRFTSSVPPLAKNKSSSLEKNISETKMQETAIGSAIKTSGTDKNKNISTKVVENPKKGTQKNEISKPCKTDEKPCDRNNAEEAKESAVRSSKRTIKPTPKAEQTEMVKSSRRNLKTTPKAEIVEKVSIKDSNSITSPGGSKNTPKRKQRPKVVFTMMDDPQLESHIKQIGGSVVDSIEKATVLVTQNVKRSQKLLAAVGQGKPVCSPAWIVSSKKKHDFLDPWDFLLVDEEAEKRWNFSLKESLERASKKSLLSDYTFHLMVSKAEDVLKDAIEACGGKCVSRVAKKLPPGNFVIIASPDQKSKYSKFIKQNPEIKVVEPEAIFDGVLRQELRLSQYALV